MTRNPTRRQLLASIGAAGATAVAGCGSGATSGGSATTSSSDGPDPIKSHSVAGTELVIEIPEDSDVIKVNLIDQSGEKRGGTTFGAGETRGMIDLVDSGFDVGENTLVAVNDAGDITTEETITLEPNLEVTEVWTPSDPPTNPPEELDWDDFSQGTAGVVVENTGTAPVLVEFLGWEGTPEVKKKDDPVPHFRRKTDLRPRGVVGVGNKANFFDFQPFDGPVIGSKCPDLGDDDLFVKLYTKRSGQVSQEFDAEVGEGCGVTIREDNSS